MGLGGVEGPPKKKLKQAQLNFCLTTGKPNNKRKLSDASDGLAPKLLRRESEPVAVDDKENVVDETDVQKKAEPDEVVVIEDSSDMAVCDSEAPVIKDERVIEEKPESSEPAKDEPPTAADTVKTSETVGETDDAVHDKPEAQEKAADSDPEELNTSVSEDDRAATSPDQKITKRKRMSTPKSASKKAEREKQREEKLRLRKEKEEQKRKEKEEKEKKKQEELRLKEEEKKKKDEERKRKEEAKKRKEEERKKKEEAKEEEKRKKEEEKKKKEEERELKEEARLAEEKKEKEKEERAKAAFTKFFITEKTPKASLPKKDETEEADKSDRPKFMPFPVKSDMRLAAHVRHSLTDVEKEGVIKALVDQPAGNTYIEDLKRRKPMTSPPTWPLSDEQHDVIIVEFVDEDKADEEAKSTVKPKRQKAKLLQFHENRRPPYWGTWRKPSSAVKPRRPFGQDKILDYEVNSDSEWEEEEEGEDIDKEGDSDKEEADDENVGENGYMLDNTFVPHGYLSDEEAEAEDDESVEDQKLKLTVLKREFDQELKAKTQRLQPRLLGPVYISNKILEVSKSLYEPLMKLRCKWDLSEEPIDVLTPVVDCNPSPVVSNTKFPSSMVEQLARLIHGNRAALKSLISEFLKNYENDVELSTISKRAVFLKVKEIASKTYSSESGRLVWTVNADLCSEFGLAPIVDSPKVVPPVEPKSKDSPLVNFLKKTPTAVKRISTTFVPKNPPRHVDTPRPNAGVNPIKPIRRVGTTLISSVASPVVNKSFNVGEIDKGTVPRRGVDLGVTPLPDVPPVLEACNLKSSPRSAQSDAPPAAPGPPTELPMEPADPPSTANDAKPSTPVRKRVPLITLSKTVTRPKNDKSPRQKVTIANMFSRQANKDASPKPAPAEPSAVIDLCNDD